jgi:hypothetical protein
MLDKNILKQSLTYSALAVAYVAVVVMFMQNAQRLLGPDDNMAAPLAFLLLLVVSAATMGMLIFGKPVMLYLDGKKREAVTMVIYTIGSLAVFTVLLIIAMTSMHA